MKLTFCIDASLEPLSSCLTIGAEAVVEDVTGGEAVKEIINPKIVNLVQVSLGLNDYLNYSQML